MSAPTSSEGRDPAAPSPWVPDALASVVVFLVAVPLCIGIAVACGVPPERGLVTGIVGGIVVGSISGAPLLVSGPAASLIVPVFDLVQSRGLAALAPVVMLAGAWQALAGLSRLGQWFRAVAPAVIRGMLIGIGVLIFASQLHVAIDGDPRASFVENLTSFPGVVLDLIATGAADGAAIGAATIVLLVAWNQYRPARLRLVPGHLVALVAVTATSLALSLDVRLLDISPRFFSGLSPVALGDLRSLLEPSVIGLSLVFAFVASAATLLTATAIDQRQSHSRADYNREMFAQGVGNMITGGVGGLPMTGVIVRSSVNVDAGARTRRSTMLHGIWILVFVVIAPQVLELIPRAALGAILVYTGFKLIDVKALRELYHQGRAELAIGLVTLFGVVFVELFAGIVAGLAAATVKLVYTFTKLDIRADEGAASSVYHLHLTGSATFVQLPRLAEALDAVPADRELHVHIDELDHIDHACLELLSSWNQRREAEGALGMIVEWDELTDRYRKAIVGTREARPSKSLLRVVWDEWKHVYRGRRSDRPEPMITERWIEADRVRARLASETIEGVLTEAALLLAPRAGVSEADLAARLIARAEGHIVLGDGVSLPHAPIEGLKRPIAAIVTTAAPIEVDGEPADVFFVLLAPEADPQAHLRALAQVGRLCHDPALLDRLRGAETAREVVAAIEDASASATDPEPPTRDGARLLAIVEVSRGRAGERLAELLAEAFVPPLTLERDDPSFGPLRRVIRAEEDHLLLVIPIEPRDTEVLETLVSEQARLTREARARVHLLHPERVDAAPEALVAQSSMA